MGRLVITMDVAFESAFAALPKEFRGGGALWPVPTGLALRGQPAGFVPSLIIVTLIGSIIGLNMVSQS